MVIGFGAALRSVAWLLRWAGHQGLEGEGKSEDSERASESKALVRLYCLMCGKALPYRHTN